MTMKALSLSLLLALAAGCATVQNHDKLVQPTGKNLETYVGGSIFRVNRSRDLPNAVGGADLFGGKVFAGYTELRYQGLTDDGKLVLRVTEVETHSTESTMSRRGQTTGEYQGQVNSSGNVSGSLTVRHPPKGSTQVLPPNTTEFLFDPAKEQDVAIAGVRVFFLESTAQKLRYRLATQP